jgi:hypothetical protein
LAGSYNKWVAARLARHDGDGLLIVDVDRVVGQSPNVPRATVKRFHDIKTVITR